MDQVSSTQHPLKRYYQLHARVYDVSRWLFLFGRQTLIQHIVASGQQPQNILEIGCGTGKNLLALHRQFPQAQLTGIDLSEDMLAQAQKKLHAVPSLQLRQHYYKEPISRDSGQPFDLIVLSYALSMMNPGWDQVIACAENDLAVGGQLAVVDFATSQFAWFQNWMRFNHVRMDGHLIPQLERHLNTSLLQQKSAYVGLWQYFTFLGEKTN